MPATAPTPRSSLSRRAPLERILYVDDDLDIQFVARFALEELAGLKVEVAHSGAEALVKLPCFLPDLVLLDIMMPDMDGFATLDALRRLPAGAATPVIFMTASGDLATRCGELGSLGVIIKPFDPIALPRRLRELWGMAE